MPEPNLNLKYADFLSEVGFNLGWGRGPWNSRHTTELQAIVPQGLQQFYTPPPTTQGGESYRWSFMRPIRTLTIPSGTREALLPDDFGGFEASYVYIRTGENSAVVPARVCGDQAIADAYARNINMTGRPRLVADQWMPGTTSTRSQRAKMVFFPEADADYTMEVQYYILGEALTTTHPYAYGGSNHRNTVMQSCLAVAETKIDGLPPMQGPQWQLFMMYLATSISVDQRRKSRTVGYNGDGSDDAEDSRRGRHGYDGTIVTFNDVIPG